MKQASDFCSIFAKAGGGRGFGGGLDQLPARDPGLREEPAAAAGPLGQRYRQPAYTNQQVHCNYTF